MPHCRRSVRFGETRRTTCMAINNEGTRLTQFLATYDDVWFVSSVAKAACGRQTLKGVAVIIRHHVSIEYAPRQWKSHRKGPIFRPFRLHAAVTIHRAVLLVSSNEGTVKHGMRTKGVLVCDSMMLWGTCHMLQWWWGDWNQHCKPFGNSDIFFKIHGSARSCVVI